MKARVTKNLIGFLALLARSFIEGDNGTKFELRRITKRAHSLALVYNVAFVKDVALVG